VADEGHEIGIHSWIHEANTALPPGVERELTFRAADVLETLSGRRPVGIRTASWDFSTDTLAIIRELGLLYDSSLMADDDPYELLDHGNPTGIVELPPEWIRDDAPYFNFVRFSALRPYTAPSAVEEIFRAEFDGAHAEGGMFLLTMHPHVIGHRSRIGLLDRLVQHMRAKGDVWFATHEEVARHVRDQAGG
jgi:peptidoglycan/xylan/chitin deacetylase (PgdA/CDA1 family)